MAREVTLLYNSFTLFANIKPDFVSKHATQKWQGEAELWREGDEYRQSMHHARKQPGGRAGSRAVGRRGVRRPPHLFIIIKEARRERESDGGEWIICSIGEMGLRRSQLLLLRPLPNPVITRATTERTE